MHEDFCPAPPHRFTLEYRGPEGGEWQVVAGPEFDVSTLSDDDTERCRGYSTDDAYRVRMEDGDGNIYVSGEAHTRGLLQRRAWLAAREALRGIKLHIRQGGYATLEGRLLKHISSSSLPKQKPSRDIDPVTGDRITARPSRNKTTGKVESSEYWWDKPTTLINMAPGGDASRTDLEAGPVNPGKKRQAVFHGPFPPEPKDVWVALDGSGRRFEIGAVQFRSELGGVVLLADAQIAELPADHPAHKIALPDD